MPIWRKASEMQLKKDLETVYAELINEDGVQYPSMKCSGYFNSDGYFIWHYPTIPPVMPQSFDRLMILDESEPSFSISDMRDCWSEGSLPKLNREYGPLFKDYMKAQHNITLKD